MSQFLWLLPCLQPNKRWTLLIEAVQQHQKPGLQTHSLGQILDFHSKTKKEEGTRPWFHLKDSHYSKWRQEVSNFSPLIWSSFRNRTQIPISFWVFQNIVPSLPLKVGVYLSECSHLLPFSGACLMGDGQNKRKIHKLQSHRIIQAFKVIALTKNLGFYKAG